MLKQMKRNNTIPLKPNHTLLKILSQQPLLHLPHQGLILFLFVFIAHQMKKAMEDDTVELSVERLTQG